MPEGVSAPSLSPSATTVQLMEISFLLQAVITNSQCTHAHSIRACTPELLPVLEMSTSSSNTCVRGGGEKAWIGRLRGRQVLIFIEHTNLTEGKADNTGRLKEQYDALYLQGNW